MERLAVLIARRSPAQGFTLAELLVAITLLGVVSTVVLGVVLRQQRFHRATLALLEARRAARDAADVLRSDLRAISPAAGDLLVMGADHLELRAATGTSIVCAMSGARDIVHLPPRAAAAGALTSWIVPPEPGDTVLVRAMALAPAAARWDAHVLAAEPGRGGCPTAGGFVASAAESASAIALRIVPPLAPDVHAGAALRIVRRARYELYRAGDARWYLGYRDCLATRALPCSTIQPVSGPFAPDGLRFVYRDSSGAQTTDPARVRRIDVAVVARSRVVPSVGISARPASESLALTIAPRN